MNHPRVVDVKSWIDARPISRFQWNVLLLCFVIIMLDGYDAAVMGFIAPALIEDWGISRAEMGPILGAAMFGVALGALVAGPLSDRYGRKRILLWSVAFFALFSLAAALAQSPSQLALMRFLTGLGLGAVMPNCVTLVAEYMPERRKGLMITLMYSGFNVGSGLGGFIAAGLLSHYSWHSALIFGGVLPLVVLPFMVVMLPESAMNMVARRLPGEHIARVLNRLGGSFDSSTVFQLNAPQISRRSKVAQLFRNGYARGTLALWLTYFMGLFVIYLLNGWLPTILRSGGLSLQQAAIITGLFQLGGPLGGILVGYLMDRGSAKAVIAVTYFLGCMCLLTQGLMDFGSAALAVLIFISGMCINGAQNGLQAYSPAYYQTEIRATGVSWMHGIGRSGAILSSTLGGVIMLAVPGHSSIFLVLALPACLAGIAILLHRMNHPKPRQTEADLNALSQTLHNR
ncbi:MULTISPECIES: MFS transporter [Raoultella]|jgi:benzoate transport|uniref:4-hydroxybenzoate transporter n=1 Tax=Raoultella planticola TaxID=575 RepID=A0A2C5UUQ8_RAOPL|nr:MULTISPECIES: aromatic acid/H+ symport family MFS transporter [Raoultella]MDU4421256.1 aromatic acid/H+ symport family MFS transporter [Raoultella sp.]ATM08008.1 MFS transporter [Raoultella planticola]ATM14782.1 MFS transporter [Raoultella planticola]AUU03811.1 MFS transporter [Raoultella planticola]EIY2674428.1 aromatic acid/H+ symport family MFS transporter [Raoultella planticola]